MKRIAPLLITAVLSFPCLADAAGGTREVLLDNPTVQVVRLTYPAGSESGMHSHVYPHRVVYVVKGGTLEMVPEDGEAPRQTLEVADGQAVFVPGGTHNVRNVGETEVVIVETEIK
jgi:mannose-6-phosphate isomerase-like protein (cupin superfamily)